MKTIEECRNVPALAETLWTERHLVEHLLYRLVSARLLLASEERRFLGAALAEVEETMARLWDAETARSAALASVADDWREPRESVTLGRLIEECPPPWGEMFADHQAEFQRLATEIEQTAAENRRLASVSLTSISDSLSSLIGNAPQTYTAAGRADTAAAAPTRVNQVL